MRTVNVHEAKTHLSRLLDAAVAGEEIVIAKGGKPFVRLTPVLTADRVPGAAKGRGALTEAFFEPLPEEELTAWE
ncbi:MAG: type II toxin-antitoxin system Phd/YefM family antitoxin [Syntrophobacterales bacterium]|nr:type II toxin-antitoxin system Phd/YefM family antitoxin [Syntrophobacterales bacterium]